MPGGGSPDPAGGGRRAARPPGRGWRPARPAPGGAGGARAPAGARGAWGGCGFPNGSVGPSLSLGDTRKGAVLLPAVYLRSREAGRREQVAGFSFASSDCTRATGLGEQDPSGLGQNARAWKRESISETRQVSSPLRGMCQACRHTPSTAPFPYACCIGKTSVPLYRWRGDGFSTLSTGEGQGARMDGERRAWSSFRPPGAACTACAPYVGRTLCPHVPPWAMTLSSLELPGPSCSSPQASSSFSGHLISIVLSPPFQFISKSQCSP